MSKDELKELEPKNINKGTDNPVTENAPEKEKPVEERLFEIENRLKNLEMGTFKPGKTRRLEEPEFVSLHQNLDILTKDT